MRNKNTSKETTVAQYIDEFLKGRSPEAAREFRERPLAKQYSSIIQWRRHKRIKEITPESVTEIHSSLSALADMIIHAPEISETDSQTIYQKLDDLKVVLANYMERQKATRIRALEEENRRIQEELQALRGY